MRPRPAWLTAARRCKNGSAPAPTGLHTQRHSKQMNTLTDKQQIQGQNARKPEKVKNRKQKRKGETQTVPVRANGAVVMFATNFHCRPRSSTISCAHSPATDQTATTTHEETEAKTQRQRQRQTHTETQRRTACQMLMWKKQKRSHTLSRAQRRKEKESEDKQRRQQQQHRKQQQNRNPKRRTKQTQQQLANRQHPKSNRREVPLCLHARILHQSRL